VLQVSTVLLLCELLHSKLWQCVDVLQVSTVLLCELLHSKLWQCVDVLQMSTPLNNLHLFLFPII